MNLLPTIPSQAESNYRSWIWLIPAILLLPFANGVSNVPLAAWLAPLFLLRFVRLQKIWIGLPIAYFILAVAFGFQFRGMVPIPGIGYYIFLAIFGLLLIFPFIVDRLITPYLDGIWTTLVFPTSFVAIEYITSLAPYGSWGSIAYTQYGNLALLQLISVTGLWGITFLIAWFVAIINWAWDEGLRSKRVQVGVSLFALQLLVITFIGEARIGVFPASSSTTRMASLSRTVIKPEASTTAWNHLLKNKMTTEEAEEIRRWSNAVNDDLMLRTEREAEAGAKIVFWGEGNASVFKEEEAALVRRGSELASKYKIYLGMGMATWHKDASPLLENKFVFIEPTGQVAWEFFKARPIPGGEAEMSFSGDGKLPSLETPYGRISSIICFDADFPGLLAQAGKMRTDVMLDPSNDWRAIDPWHTQMASFRAIEQGFNLIRQTDNGLSASFDYQGKRLAVMDHYQAVDRVMVSQIPSRGVITVYSLLGDWFAWLCLALVFLLSAKAIGLLT